MDTERRKSYDTGGDYVLEYGELRFSFNENDFAERVEDAARKLGFIDGTLDDEELTDLLCLAINGEICEPTSPLGDHVNGSWNALVGPAERSLVHWLRRLVFRGAWLDQRVKDGDLDVVFEQDTSEFKYVQKGDRSELVELKPKPSWSEVAYRP